MGRVVRIGIGGPVGCGKTELIEKLIPKLAEAGLKSGAISNDVYSKEDAFRLERRLGGKYADQGLIVGIETGGCPHTAVRDDPSMNVAAAEEMEKRHPDLDLILIESGGDNITLTFSPKLADFFIYMVDVAGGDKTVRKGGLGIKKSDILVINKIDLAPYVETTISGSTTSTANVDLMLDDAKTARGDKPTIPISLKEGTGVTELASLIRERALFR